VPVLFLSTDRLVHALVLLRCVPAPAFRVGRFPARGYVRPGNTTTMRLLGLCLSIALCSAVPVHAQDIYKCADPDGRVTYSNVPSKSCRKLVLDPVNLAPSSKSSATGTRTPTPGSFPKVDEQTQKSRDGDRRRILENELAAEQKNAEQAKKDLAEQETIVLPSERMQGGAISGGKVQERLQTYKDKVALHQRNIEAIQKEIANLR